MPLFSNGQLSSTFTNPGASTKSKTSTKSTSDAVNKVRPNTQPYVAGSANNAVGAKSQKQDSDYVSQMRSAADAKQDAAKASDEAARKAAEERRVNTASDQFMTLYENYADENLDDMGLGEFLTLDGSQENRDMWRAFTDDPIMGLYYADVIDQAGGFDNWYNQRAGITLEDIMADPNLQVDNFGGSYDTVHAIHDYAAANGWVPDVSGDGVDALNMRNLLYSDPALAASVMDYMFGMNALSLMDDATDVFSVDEMNDLFQLGKMEFGYGDDYSYDYDEYSVPDEGEQFLAVDPEFWLESTEGGWSSVPGYGLPNRGAMALMNKNYDTGFAVRPGVEDAYASYSQQQGGEQQ